MVYSKACMCMDAVKVLYHLDIVSTYSFQVKSKCGVLQICVAGLRPLRTSTTTAPTPPPTPRASTSPACMHALQYACMHVCMCVVSCYVVTRRRCSVSFFVSLPYLISRLGRAFLYLYLLRDDPDGLSAV